MPHHLKLGAAQLTQLTTNDDIARPLWISFRNDPALSVYPEHGHAWGEFIYAFNGVMEVNINQTDYLTPPPYGIWLPPNLQHSGLNRTAVSHGTLYIHEQLCGLMPKQAGILLSSNVVKAIFEHLQQHPLPEDSPEQQRLLQVLLDQLQQAQLVSSYLPHASHPALVEILEYLHQHPADNSPLHVLAQHANMTERTLARYCLKELGMSLNEWRQRLKVIKAMSMLTEGKKVESIALDLGYANASAFINMFKRWMNLTPDQFRKLQ